MTYTAADEHGDEASFDFTITVQAAPRTAKSTILPHVRNPQNHPHPVHRAVEPGH